MATKFKYVLVGGATFEGTEEELMLNHIPYESVIRKEPIYEDPEKEGKLSQKDINNLLDKA